MTTTNGHRPNSQQIRKSLMERFADAVESGKPKTARRLLESYWLWDGFGGSEMWDRLRPRTNDGDGGIWLPPNVPTDRARGANWPFWRNQVELDEHRQQSRVIATTNSFAIGMLKTLTNTAIGKGYSYKAQVLDPDGKPAPAEKLSDNGKEYQKQVQDVIDKFLKANHWNCSIDPTDVTALGGTREREIYRAVQTDGECFLRFHEQDDGTLQVRIIDAAQIREGGEYLPQEGWSYGIQHKMDPFQDVETPLKYAVFWMDVSAKGGEGGSAADKGSWEELEAEEVLHMKGMDTPSNVKRGLPLFAFGVGEALERAAKLQRNTSAGAAIRAAIAETWQYDQATQAQISSMAQALAERTQTNPVTGQTTPIERVHPGTIRRGPTGASLVQPSADNSPAFMAAKDGDLQAGCAGAGIASFVLGGLESGNYSNFESASYPPVQNATCEQEYYKLAFARVVWKAIMWAKKCGELPSDVMEKIVLNVEAPAVLHRNELEKAQEDQILVENGIKDRQTCAAERGLDWHTVSANNDGYQKKQQALNPQPQAAGAPGANGKPGAPGKPPPKAGQPGQSHGSPAAVRESFDPSEPRDKTGEVTDGKGNL
jgi:hypothetical protein